VELEDEQLARRGVRLLLKRDDLIHPDFPGNKWRKLKYNIVAAKEQGASTLLTFGGAYSNHIRATAAAGHYFGFETVGVIRGEAHDPLNETLAYAARLGMRLTYMDRSTYRKKTDTAVIGALRAEFGDFFFIPEGGGNPAGVQGCRELVSEIEVDFDVIACACGTGATLAGVAAGLRVGQRAIGFAVLKGGEFLNGDVADLQRATFSDSLGDWSIETGFHFGGFARRNDALDSFVESFRCRHGIALDWVYEAKMMYGVFDFVERGAFPPGTTVLAVIAG
jgi:1-aminocyclopropane-1-carboxylate deaminase